MSQRQDFVSLAGQEGVSLAELCRRFGISRKTGYKWLRRAAAGEVTFTDRSRRPASTPGITPPVVDAVVLALREEHPAWGGRKLHHALQQQGLLAPPPAPSTITAILRRHGQLDTPVRSRRD